MSSGPQRQGFACFGWNDLLKSQAHSLGVLLFQALLLAPKVSPLSKLAFDQLILA